MLKLESKRTEMMYCSTNLLGFLLGIWLNTYTYSHAHTHARTHTGTRSRTHTRIQTETYAYIRHYVYIDVYMFACVYAHSLEYTPSIKIYDRSQIKSISSSFNHPSTSPHHPLPPLLTRDVLQK